MCNIVHALVPCTPPSYNSYNAVMTEHKVSFWLCHDVTVKVTVE